MGLSFQHPADWGVQRTADGLILTPPNPRDKADGIPEAYFIMGEATLGVRRADDPRIASDLDELMAGQAPGLVRQGEPTHAPCGRGDGAILRWAGRSGSAPMEALAMVSVLDEMVVALLAIGPESSIRHNEPTLRSIFAGFAAGEGGAEQSSEQVALVGVWRREVRQGPVDDLAPSSTIHLRPDGSFIEDGAYKGSQGAWERGVYENEPASPPRGRWEAREDHLLLVHSDGRRDERMFHLNAESGMRHLVLTAEDGHREYWIEA